jgi:hypothetical protein
MASINLDTASAGDYADASSLSNTDCKDDCGIATGDIFLQFKSIFKLKSSEEEIDKAAVSLPIIKQLKASR